MCDTSRPGAPRENENAHFPLDAAVQSRKTLARPPHAGRRARSAPAIERAIAIGADLVEIDVRRCADGAMVLVHDAVVDGIPVGALTRDALAARLGHEPATLAEALDRARGRIAVNVELKEDGYMAEAVDVLRAGIATADLLVTSFLDPVMAELTRLASELSRGLLVELVADGAVRRARACGASVLSLSLALADGGLLEAAYAAGLRCVVWEVDADADLARVLADHRVAAVITDRPEAALAMRAGAR